MGLRNQSPSEVDEILAWYAQYGAPCHFDIVPRLISQALLQTLADCSFSKSGSHASLFAIPAEDFPEPPTGIDVIEVLAGHMEIFADLYMVYLDDFRYPEGLKARVRANIIKEYRQPGWRLYLAAVDGAPAAFASLYVKDRIGSLAMAAAAPSSRGRGAHTALLNRRIGDCRRRGLRIGYRSSSPRLDQPPQHGAGQPESSLHQGHLVTPSTHHLGLIDPLQQFDPYYRETNTTRLSFRADRPPFISAIFPEVLLIASSR